MKFTPDFTDIEKASRLITPFLNHTPVITSRQVNGLAGGDLYFKCENFQKVGAFKFRGATNAIMNLSDEERSRGVVTHSSGNHAAALAHAAVSRGVRAYIVMPETSPEVKKRAVSGYGAEITYCKPTLEARESTCEAIMERTGATLVHPYDNFFVIAGQGTAAMELLHQWPDLDVIIAPVGGGGLLSGTALAARGVNSKIKVYGAEPEMADDACRSLKAGRIIPSDNPKTIADGLRTSLCERTFTILSQNVDDILTVSEQSIIEAMLLIWERMKIVVEPSSATVLAAVLANRELFTGKKTGLIISGGNVDLRKLPFNEIS
ncbi:MAG TPA: pyridoxal-phosphate dependent enzyme [Bacteroidales bacterium]|nr:pyridoxal-phosphate dependent enzyme [Bacteroidales bacterium]HPT11075.1 pyridoxal-phosphate dependent enzyme [Bacteroidales bacterium]